MAEYIEREAVLRAIQEDMVAGALKMAAWEALKRYVKRVPAADVAPVVRCKSCKHSKWSDVNKSYYCKRRWAMHKVRDRDFCSYGKRRNDHESI